MKATVLMVNTSQSNSSGKGGCFVLSGLASFGSLGSSPASLGSSPASLGGASESFCLFYALQVSELLVSAGKNSSAATCHVRQVNTWQCYDAVV